MYFMHVGGFYEEVCSKKISLTVILVVGWFTMVNDNLLVMYYVCLYAHGDCRHTWMGPRLKQNAQPCGLWK